MVIIILDGIGTSIRNQIYPPEFDLERGMVLPIKRNLLLKPFYQIVLLHLLNGRNVDSKDINLNYDINLTYTLTPSKDKELNILGLYSRNNRTSNYLSDLYNSVDFQTISSRIKNDNPSYNDESTLQIDYQAPLSKRH